MCPRPARDHAGASARASAIGARRLTSSIRSICSCVSSVSTPLAGSAALATSTSTSPASLGEPLDVVAVREIAGDRAAADLLGQRLEHVGSAAGQRSGRAPRAANARAIACADARRWRRSPARLPPTRLIACAAVCVPVAAAQPGNTASVAVKPCRKLRPPTGPISPAAKKPAAGRAAELVARPRPRRGRGVPNIARPAAIAGEHERAGRRLAGERLDAQPERAAQILVGRSRVPRVQADDLALADRGADDRGRPTPDRRRARRGRGSRPARTRACRRRSRSRSGARRRPAPARRGVSSAMICSTVSSAGPPGELVDHVALGRGDRQLAAERRRALRDARKHLDAAQAHADRALVVHLIADRTARPRRPASARSRARRAPGRPGVARPARRAPRSVGNEYGSESMNRAAGAVELGQPARATPTSIVSSLVGHVSVERLGLAGAAEATRPTPATAVSRLELATRAEHAAGRRSRPALAARARSARPRASPRARAGARRSRTRPRDRRRHGRAAAPSRSPPRLRPRAGPGESRSPAPARAAHLATPRLIAPRYSVRCRAPR